MDDVWWFLYNALSLKIGYPWPNQFPSFGQTRGLLQNAGPLPAECPQGAWVPACCSPGVAKPGGGTPERRPVACYLPAEWTDSKVCWGNPFSTGTWVRKVLSGRQMGVYHVDVEPKKIQQTFGLRNIWKQMGFLLYTLVFLLFSFFFSFFVASVFFFHPFFSFFFPFWLSIFSHLFCFLFFSVLLFDCPCVFHFFAFFQV